MAQQIIRPWHKKYHPVPGFANRGWILESPTVLAANRALCRVDGVTLFSGPYPRHLCSKIIQHSPQLQTSRRLSTPPRRTRCCNLFLAAILGVCTISSWNKPNRNLHLSYLLLPFKCCPQVLEMKRLSLVGEQVCRTFTANNFATEIHRTVTTTDIEKERQYMDLKRKIEAVRFDFRPSLIGS